MINEVIEPEMTYSLEICNVIQSSIWGACLFFKIEQNYQVGSAIFEVTCLTNWSATSRKKQSYELIVIKVISHWFSH